MCLAVLAHHVVAHQAVHQPGRLVRGEQLDALLLAEDVVAAGEDGRAELRHEGDRYLLPHPREIGIRIGPESLHVDRVMRGVGHGAAPSRISFPWSLSYRVCGASALVAMHGD